ncbi:MAG TPA: glucosamine-6-phosphate deaminase [Abditibacteriaceae bacterium]
MPVPFKGEYSMKNVQIRSDYLTLCAEVAQMIAELIRRKPDAVLGLATGSSPLGVYDELIRLHREEALDFSQVTIFNLDEYFPMPPDDPQSYHFFMHENLLKHINCRNFNIPRGEPRDSEQVQQDCRQYEDLIVQAGGIDFQLLGIGRTGHIGFNEPGSPRESRTRMVTLHHQTRLDAAEGFGGIEHVPVRALTMGMATILEARQIVLMAAGRRKAAIVHAALEEKITSKVPASFLREHANTTWYLDAPAASQLSEYSHPWSAPEANWHDFSLRRRALISVAQEVGKPLGQLSASDLQETACASLLNQYFGDDSTTLHNAIAEVEQDLKQRTDDEAHLPRNATVLCLSPHPDDDVICCGATLGKLVERGNQVVVTYGVSGDMAVRDKDVLGMLAARHALFETFIAERIARNEAPGSSFEEVATRMQLLIFARAKNPADAKFLRELKRLVREGEASAACRKLGTTPLFLNLPFYRTGTVGKNPIGPADVAIMLSALREVQPDIVLLTGELNDPHGTHEMCAEAFARAASEYSQSGAKAFTRWNYRGAWDEYEPWEGDYFSIFGAGEMERKISLILDHVSQLDPLFPGESDPREFYERARDRNRATARQLQALGVLPPSRSFDPLFAEVFRIP